MYTTEKLISLKRTVALHNSQLDLVLDKMRSAADKLEDTMTMKQISVLDDLRSARKAFEHFRHLGAEFESEITKQISASKVIENS